MNAARYIVADVDETEHIGAMSELDEDPYEPGQRRGDIDWGSWRPTINQRLAVGLFLVIWGLLERSRVRWGILVTSWLGSALPTLIYSLSGI